MKLKLDEKGNAILQDGKPVYVHDDGKEIPFDAPAAMGKISALRGHSSNAYGGWCGHLDFSNARRRNDVAGSACWKGCEIMLFHQAMMAAAGVSHGVAARYWRLLPTDVSWTDPYGGSTPYFQAIYEFRLLNATGTNVALGKTASALTEITTFPATKANDGDTKTYWQVATGVTVPQWWYVDLVTPIAVTNIQILGYVTGGSYYAKSYSVQRSDDASTWITIKAINTVFNVADQTFPIQ